MVTTRVDFNVNDSPRSIVSFLKRTTVIRAPHVDCWTLDLTQCHYLGPDCAAIIVAEFLVAKRAGTHCTVQLPFGDPALEAFMAFSGLRHLLINGVLPSQDHPDNVTIPVQVRTTSAFNDPDPVILLIRRHAQLSDETEEYLRICINEVVQNVEDHAQSSIGCVTCARFMRNIKEIRVAIVDHGIGIGTTLRSGHPSIKSTDSALRHVFSGGYSAKSRTNNMGVGISNLCNIVTKQLHGELFVISEDAFAEVRRLKLPVVNSLGTDFRGTGVFFSIPIP